MTARLARCRAWVGALAVAAAAGSGAAVAASADADNGVSRCVPASPEDRIDQWMRLGYEQPEAARAGLHALQAEPGPVAAGTRRARLYAEATVAAASGDAAQVQAPVAALRALAERDGDRAADPIAGAAADIALATLAETTGQPDRAGTLSERALVVLSADCEIDLADTEPGSRGAAEPASTAAPPLAPSCDYRLAWRALQLGQMRAAGQGLPAVAAAHLRAQQRLALRAGDAWRQAYGSASLAVARAQSGDAEGAATLLHQAQHLAQPLGDPLLLARIGVMEGGVADARGDTRAAREATERALPLAQRAGAERLEALLLSNLADGLIKAGDPAAALRAAERALPAVRRHNDERMLRVLLHNIGLAKIGLGRLAEARQDLERLLASWARTGAVGDQAAALREYGEALATAGDAAAALALYHRERALTSEALARNRHAALQALQARNEMQRKQRDIELLSRDNALKAAELENRGLTQRLWALAATVLLLAGVLAALLYRQARRTRRRLEHSQAQLRVQSESDPLTHLANRRHFQTVMQAMDGSRSFRGALLLVDLDHFKHVNDEHGHAAGDVVLCEVARRLREAVRDADLVVRWGGEEFLILAREVPADQLDALAARVLHAIADRPIALRGGPGTPPRLTVTASIGYARFPLPPQDAALGWEQAVNLVDMSLYVAKSHGRNRAVGLMTVQATGAEGLQRVAADFEQAWAQGQIDLQVTLGPPGGPVGASPDATSRAHDTGEPASTAGVG